MSKLKHALELAAAGHRVFPLTPNGKTPAHAGANWRKIASSDPARVTEMWTDPVFDTELDYNIGIALDKNTLVVDIDVRDGKKGAESLALLEAIYDDLPATYTVRSASGGEHRYFHVEDSGAFAKTLATDIDLKGEGGYVVGPGSEIDGKRYEIADCGGLRNGADRDRVAHAPDWFLQHAGGGTRTRDVGVGGKPAVVLLDTPSAITRAAEWLEQSAPEAVEGAGGDNVTIQVANRVGDFGVSAQQAAELMLDHWNEAKANPPWDSDELERKVANAFKSRQNPIGIASAEAEFDAVEINAKPAKRKGLYVVRWGDAKPVLDQPYLVDKVIDLGTMVVTYGDSNVGKTYVKLDQCFHIAAGIDWNGHKVKQGLVVYVAAEGGTGFLKRIEAFKRHYGVQELPFSLVPCPIDLQSDNADTAKLIKLIRGEEAHFGMKCVLTVIDTLARAMGGGDENTTVDMGKFVGHSDALRAAIGSTVDIIHHTGKDKAKGARGSSALRAATDTEIEIREGEFEATKQRDMARGKALKFELVNVEVGKRLDGEAVDACVVRWTAVNDFDVSLSPAAQEMFDIMEQMDAAERDAIDAGDAKVENDKCDIWMPWNAMQISFLSQIKGAKGKGVGRSALFKIRQELSQAGKIKRDQQNQWAIVKSH